MEAMASGLPVVASDIPAHHELIEHGRTGFLASDPESMARFAGGLVQDEALRHEVGESGRRFVQARFAAEACARSYVELYRSVLNGTHEPSPTMHTSLDV
jgi:glycosyltransferase involved in cell wall biosynthesis